MTATGWCCRRTRCICARTTFLWQNAAHMRIGVRNHGTVAAQVALTIRFASDFADIFEVRGMRRPRRGRSRRRSRAARSRCCSPMKGSTARSASPRSTSIRRRRGSTATTRHSRSRSSRGKAARCSSRSAATSAHIQRPYPFLRALAQATREMRATKTRRISAGTSSDVFNQILARSVADLDMLSTATEHGPYPLRRHPLVLDDLRPRRHHHRAGDAVVRTAHGARGAVAPRGAAGDGA